MKSNELKASTGDVLTLSLSIMHLNIQLEYVYLYDSSIVWYFKEKKSILIANDIFMKYGFFSETFACSFMAVLGESLLNLSGGRS